MKTLQTGKYLTVAFDLEFDDNTFIKEGTRLEIANYCLQYEGFVTVFVDGDIQWFTVGSFLEWQ